MVFSTLPGFGDQVFAVIVLVLSAGISSHIMYGYGTRKAKESFVGLILLLLFAVQLFHLIPAATLVPASNYYVWEEKYHRSDCKESGKGGKRPMRTKEAFDKNPCYCHAGARCVNDITGLLANSSVGECPINDVTSCFEDGHIKVHAYVSFRRDCAGGFGAQCTRDQPCLPCDIASLQLWNKTSSYRCRSCATDFRGDCGFVPEVGPYCLIKPGSKQVQPCQRCCTEPEAVYSVSGNRTTCL